MFKEKLEEINSKFKEVEQKLSDSNIIADQEQYRSLSKEHSYLSPIVEKSKEYFKLLKDIDDLNELKESDDKEMKEMAFAEYDQAVANKEKMETEIRLMLIPPDPHEDKDIIVEIRAGTGGEEAALFGQDLLRMYLRYAERNRWKTELIDINDTGMGGIKEAIMLIKGKGAYSRLKYESGAHRVQRVPETESSGRVHTSAATIAVLPEVDDVEVDLNPNDVRVDVYRASGNGGQCVNTTDSAVRLTHEPTGLVVTCQDEKSQIKNKEKAFKVLKARLYDLEMQKQQDEIAGQRKSMVGSGDRSERIRTYNFPQGRVSDHRIGMTIYKLDTFLDGDIDEIVDGLITSDQAEKMKNF